MEENNNLPKHIAIILDGNRRWAKSKGLPTAMGHKTGADNIEKIANHANKLGIKYMTVYAFSTENWKRSEEEVSALMKLLQFYLDDFAKRAASSNMKLNMIGNLGELDEKYQKGFKKCMDLTANNTGIVLNVAFNYGGRQEILKATREIAEEFKEGKISLEDVNEEMFSNHLYTANMPDPDLLIRTSGESRISGFLLWQLSYTEFLFVDKNWPDFSEKDLDLAIEEYKKRNRKFGGK